MGNSEIKIELTGILIIKTYRPGGLGYYKSEYECGGEVTICPWTGFAREVKCS